MTKGEKEFIEVNSISNKEYANKIKEQEAVVLKLQKQLDELKMPIKENTIDGIEE